MTHLKNSCAISCSLCWTINFSMCFNCRSLSYSWCHSIYVTGLLWNKKLYEFIFAMREAKCKINRQNNFFLMIYCLTNHFNLSCKQYSKEIRQLLLREIFGYGHKRIFPWILILKRAKNIFGENPMALSWEN